MRIGKYRIGFNQDKNLFKTEGDFIVLKPVVFRKFLWFWIARYVDPDKSSKTPEFKLGTVAIGAGRRYYYCKMVKK